MSLIVILFIYGSTSVVKNLIIGASVNLIYGASLGYLNQHFTVTGRLTSILLVADVLGEFIWTVHRRMAIRVQHGTWYQLCRKSYVIRRYCLFG